jgi:spermidine/putrescine transport system permease protein
MTAGAIARPARADPGRSRSRFVTGALLFPAALWYLLLLVAPLLIVVVFSVGEKAPDGGYAPALTGENFAGVLERPDPFIDSLRLAFFGTLLTLAIALPLAYFIATRARKRKALLVLLLVIPFWTSFLVRAYSWLIILGPRGLAGIIGDATGDAGFKILGTEVGVLVGMVYGYLPLMIFPIYVTIERMDRSLVEASKDLGAGRWATFRQVTLPVILPGVVTGSILVFIPMMGEYVIPAILGYGRTFLIGNALVLDFLEARHWPAGSAKAVGLIAVMLATITFYLWFINRGRQVREQSVL